MSISVKHIFKSYHGVQVLKDVNLELNTGEIVGFLGPNGAGKSTLMKIITGYISPDSGSVEILGKTVSQNGLETKRLVGYLPEHNPLYLDMYVREYLDFVADCYHLGKTKSKRIAEMIEQTGLGNEQKKKIGQLSKGYRQRVGLAQALIHNPEVLILDEPTTGLDPNQIVEIRKLIQEIGTEKTVLFSTHIMQEVSAICQRVVVINKGQIVADDTETSILNHSKRLVFEVELGRAADVDFKSIQSVLSVEKMSSNVYKIVAEKDVRGDLFKLAAEKKLTLLTMKAVENSMEEVFHELTKA